MIKEMRTEGPEVQLFSYAKNSAIFIRGKDKAVIYNNSGQKVVTSLSLPLKKIAVFSMNETCPVLISCFLTHTKFILLAIIWQVVFYFSALYIILKVFFCCH